MGGIIELAPSNALSSEQAVAESTLIGAITAVHLLQLYFSLVFLNCILILHFSAVFQNCISQINFSIAEAERTHINVITAVTLIKLHFSAVFLDCISQQYLTTAVAENSLIGAITAVTHLHCAPRLS